MSGRARGGRNHGELAVIDLTEFLQTRGTASAPEYEVAKELERMRQQLERMVRIQERREEAKREDV